MKKRLCLCLIYCLAMFSCEKVSTPSPEQKPEIEKKYDRGPMQLVLKASQKEITIAQRLILSLEAAVPEDYKVEMPDLGEKLMDFGILSYDSPSPYPVAGGKILIRKSWRLEPFLSGTYKIPPFKVFFFSKGMEKANKHEIETEEIEIKVKSLLPEKSEELKINDIAGPAEIQNRISRRFYYSLSAWILASVVVAGIFWWLDKRKSKEMAIPKRPAEEIAWDEIRRLLAEDLISKGEIKLFYERICDILRYYIENRFCLRAPERTTEEFLQELKQNSELDHSYRKILQEFMQHCDLVKFATHKPENEEIQKTFNICKEFITATTKPPG